MIKINPVFSLIRPKHWIKNLIIFSSIIFAFDFKIGSLGACFGAFLCFCLISSAIYILNDIKDIESDKLHPIKKNRPLSPYQDISLEEKDLLDNRTLISNTDRITYLEKIARQTWSNKEITSGQFLDTIHSWVFS